MRLSPYLSDPERHALLELMVAPCEARDLRDPDRWRDRELERPRDRATLTRGVAAPGPGRGAELRALRRAPARMVEPAPAQARLRRPRASETYGFGYLPGMAFEELKTGGGDECRGGAHASSIKFRCLV